MTEQNNTNNENVQPQSAPQPIIINNVMGQSDDSGKKKAPGFIKVCVYSILTGSIAVKLYNNRGEDYRLEAGDKITQLVVIPVVYEPVEQVSAFIRTARGDNGFGSTGR